MARSGFEMVLAMFLVTMLWGRVMAQSGCMPVIVSLSPCLTFIAGNSSTPSSSCCSQLSTVVQTQAQCLCTVLNGGAAQFIAQFGIPLNQTQALTLPGACKIQTPVSQCNAAAGGAATSPAESPVEAATPTSPATPSTPSVPTDPSPSTPSVPSNQSPSTPSTPSIPSGGSKTVPSTTGSTSDGSSTKLIPSLFFFLLFVASTLSSF